MSDLGAIPTATIPDVFQPKTDGDMPSVIIEVEGTDPPKQKYDAKSRTLTIENDDGSAVMLLDVDDPNRAKKTTDEDDFHRNLVDDITEGERQRIVTDLMEAVDADD